MNNRKAEVLYDILGLKRKNSIFKSVVVTNEKTYEGFRVVYVEPYDKTFLNATSTVKKYDDTIDRITDKLKEVYTEPLWVVVDEDNFGHIEILINY